MKHLKSFYHDAGKRFFDIMLTIILLALLSPIFLLIAILIYLKLGRPIFFKQRRIGFNTIPFTIYKFRSMTNERDANGNLLAAEKRLTCFGHFLRVSSLDELPQLINVLQGQMSLIGPRPLLEEFLPRFTQHQLLRFTIRPGITGLAQVKGRNNISWKKRLQFDSWYVSHLTFWLDIKILMFTVIKVIRCSDVTPVTYDVNTMDS